MFSYFSGQEKKVSKTEQALRDLNLPKFLPSVAISQFYVKPEFDVSGIPLLLNESLDQKPESDRAASKPFGAEPDQILRATEQLRSEDVDHESFILPGSVNAGKV